MNLSSEPVKKAFATFLGERKQSLGMTSEKLASLVPLDVKTVNRYLRMHDDDQWRPETIPDKTYHDLLTAVQSSHAEFASFFAQHSQSSNAQSSANAQDNSTGNGNPHIGSLQITSSSLQNSPVAAGSVTYNIDNSGKRQR